MFFVQSKILSFSSITFMCWLLPAFFIIYYAVPKAAKPWAVLVFSLFFYSWGNLTNLAVLAALILLNWLFGFAAQKSGIACFFGIAFNLLILSFYKYAGTGFKMPAGLSFVVFSAISYLVDVYTKKSGASKNPLKLALYLSLFTKITMGPIVAYSDIENQLFDPAPDACKTEGGIVRFCIGLAKKAVFAAGLANICGICWEDAANSTASAWVGIAAFSLQLYYDFSGYSDMAIGLSQMLGLSVKENFDHPYISCSVTEFWRRWHISLGGWFKEYVYIPLGGNRGHWLRVYVNLLVVWIATGIWHGKGLNFIVWGIFNCMCIWIEKALDTKSYLPKIFGWAHMAVLVMTGWVFFNSGSLQEAWEYLSFMIGNAVNDTHSIAMLCLHDNKWIIGLSLLFATPLPAAVAKKEFDGLRPEIVSIARIVLIGACLYFAITYLMVSGYTPFIYTEF